MLQLHYSKEIAASSHEVWNVMTSRELYSQWVKAFSEGSTFVGEWNQGDEIIFYDPNLGGTMAVLESVKAPEVILARHIALVDKSGKPMELPPDSEADNWIGTTESFTLVNRDGVTCLTVEIETHEDYAPMFTRCWPKALDNIARLAETDNRN